MFDEILPPFSAEARSVVKGQVYEHYKNKRYRIITIARHSESLEEHVIYQALYGDGDVWVRPISIFLETVLVEGRSHPRFKKVD